MSEQHSKKPEDVIATWRVINYFNLARPQQWLKNTFVGLPLFFGGKLFDLAALVTTAWVFAIFCLVSGAVYGLNDLHDRAADSAHPKKRHRPIACGAISASGAVIFMAALIGSAASIFVLADLPRSVGAVVLLYGLVNIAYSFGVKHVPLVELFLVASGFVFRVLAGGYAGDIEVSSWLLAMTGVIAMLIVVAKRRGEMAGAYGFSANRSSLRGYNLTYLDSMISMLAGMTILLYLLFAVSEYASSRYGKDAVLVTAPLVAFGIMRYVQIMKVSKDVDDPTELLLKDQPIAIAVILFIGAFAFIIYS
jgi:decaprenyl-phosphate phosphoribosyltransferase